MYKRVVIFFVAFFAITTLFPACKSRCHCPTFGKVETTPSSVKIAKEI